MPNESDNPKRRRGRPPKPRPEGLEPAKRPRGQPSKGADGKRVNFTCRITPKEAAEWRAEAEAQGITMAEYVLSFIRQKRK